MSKLFDEASTDEKNLIVISSRANAFKSVIDDKYPNLVIVSQVFDKKQV